MVKNKHIKVENQNGTSVLLSAAIIVDYLKNYTSEWSNLSTSSRLEEIASEFPKDNDPTNTPLIDLFNAKIGYAVPKVMLNNLINDVIVLLRDEKPEYLIMFQSFNNLEKVAIYFILMIKKDRTTSEVFELIGSNYTTLSKRDIMIKLLSEVDVEESTDDPADPINGLYRLIATTPTHSTNELPNDSFSFRTGDIEFKEFTFPMHSYNTTKRFGWLDIIPNDGVRNYYDRFIQTWKANNNIINSWSASSTSSLYKNTYWMNILADSVMSAISGSSTNRHRVVKNYRDVLSTLSYKEIAFSSTDEKPLFKYVGENFFDFNLNANTTEDQASRSPLTMTKYTGSDSITRNYFDRNNLKAGWATYNDDFNALRTALAYYTSDINFWFTSDREAINTAYSDYLHTQDANGFLTSNSKSETKGYFSNVMFLQNAIQRILFPRILKYAQGGYYSNTSDDTIFSSDQKTYDTIFDSIVNNSFVYTDKNISSNVIDGNYEIIPNRITLNTKTDDMAVMNYRDFVNYKATNLYEFILNSLVVGKDNVKSNGIRKVITVEDLNSYTKAPLVYKAGAINYNQVNTKVTNNTTSVTVSDLNTDSIVYNFGTDIYNPTNKNWIKRIVDAFFKLEDNNYSKINYRNVKFFKLPVHSGIEAITDKLNRNIVRVDRELLTDITDLANFNIAGLSLADFTYGEKALLREYIDSFKAIKKLATATSDYEVVELMKKDLDYLSAWKTNPTYVARYNKDNTYYKVSSSANPMPPNASTDYDSNPSGYVIFAEWVAYVESLKKNIYFPEMLSYTDINNIKSFLNRAIIKITKNRSYSKDYMMIPQVKELIRNSAINIEHSRTGTSDSSNIMKLRTVGTNFLTSLKLIISTIKETDEYKTAFDNFNVQFKTGSWANIGTTLTSIRDVLLDDTLIEAAIASNNLYKDPYKSSMLKDLDKALYRLTIVNYFTYLQNTEAVAESNLAGTVFVDNNANGIIKYYTDLVIMAKFAEKYHEMVPKYIKYLETNILGKYYNRINAIKSLPSWDYESLHRRDREIDLKANGGVNINDYNIVWMTGDNPGIRMVYKGKLGLSSSYRVSGSSLYSGGGLSYSGNNNIFRNRWWRKWLTSGTDTFSYEVASLFKVPNVVVSDNNVQFPEVWEYNNPDPIGKLTLFNKMRFNNNDGNTLNDEPYQNGKVANISAFKYTNGSTTQYENIGVPLLLLGDEGKEWNKPNTTRLYSFSFETDFLNLWYTDEKYSDGGSHNKGGGEAYTSNYKLVSTADKYKNFGLGNMDIQKMFRHFWNMESSPMGNPYTVMNYDIFSTWDEGYDYTKGHFPWSTTQSETFALFNDKIFSQIHKKSNKYDFKFVLDSCYKEGIWSPIRLSGEDRTIGVDPDITNDQIYDNFYLLSSARTFGNTTDLRTAIIDVYNRNFRNRVYLTYLKWRYYNNLGAW